MNVKGVRFYLPFWAEYLLQGIFMVDKNCLSGVEARKCQMCPFAGVGGAAHMGLGAWPAPRQVATLLHIWTAGRRSKVLSEKWMQQHLKAAS